MLLVWSPAAAAAAAAVLWNTNVSLTELSKSCSETVFWFFFQMGISTLTSGGVNVAAEVVEHVQQLSEEKGKYF